MVPVMNRCSFVWLGLACLFIIGCGKSYEMGQVTGTVTINGKAGSRLRVIFTPIAGLEGPRSIAKTDENGHFELMMVDKDGNSRTGALVGTHKVLLYDLQLAASDTGRGVPKRLKPEYSLPGSTPLVEDVVEGEQTIDIVIP